MVHSRFDLSAFSLIIHIRFVHIQPKQRCLAPCFDNGDSDVNAPTVISTSQTIMVNLTVADDEPDSNDDFIAFIIE